MRELEEEATVRRLPDGQACAARIRRQENGAVVLVFPCLPAACEIGAGALVEIQSPSALFLGEVSHLDTGSFTVTVEHYLPQSAVDQIGEAWSPNGQHSAGKH